MGGNDDTAYVWLEEVTAIEVTEERLRCKLEHLTRKVARRHPGRLVRLCEPQRLFSACGESTDTFHSGQISHLSLKEGDG